MKFRTIFEDHGYFNPGLDQALPNRYATALADLEAAIAQWPTYLEAHYHLGRVLFESNGDRN